MSTIYGDRSEFSNLFKTVFVDLLLSSTHKERKVDKDCGKTKFTFR